MRPDPGGHGEKVHDELVDNSRTLESRPLDASVFDDGRLNFVELGIVGWLERQPSRRASIDKLRIIGGGCERSGPLLLNACKILATLGYVHIADGMIELTR